MEIISRVLAIESNKKRYFTGKPCVHGHICERITSNGYCLECAKQYARKRYKSNPNRVREIAHNWYLKNSNKGKKYARDRYRNNKELVLESQRKYISKNPDAPAASSKKWRNANKERVYKYNKKYRKQNADKFRFYALKRLAAKLKRTPAWADLNKIKEFYERAHIMSLESGKKYQVDHVIPLQGKLVSGLHVENNLNIITKKENVSKKNRFAV